MPILHFDPANYLRIDEPVAMGTSGSGASFATSTGDVLEVTSFGPGAFRLRIGPHAKPDYGIVVARAKPCAIAQPRPGEWTFTAGDMRVTIGSAPLHFRADWKEAPVLASITDRDVHGASRLPAFGRIRRGDEWTAAVALASGEAVYGLGEKFGLLDKRGQLVHSQVEDAKGVNTGLSYKNAPFAWSPGIGRGAWGLFVNTPGRVAHGVGFPDWSHRSYALVVDDEALDLFLIAADAPAGVLDRYTELTGRPAEVPLWSLGLWVSRAYYRTPQEAVDVAAKLRQRRIPCDVLTLDGRAAWKVDTRFNFRWDPDRFANPRGTLAAIRSHNLRVCVWEYPLVSVNDPLFAELASRDYLLKDAYGEPYVHRWESVDATPRDAVPTALPDSGIVDFTHPGAYVWWRDAHRALFEDGVDVIKSDFGEQVPSDAVAYNGDAGHRLHNVYPLLYNRCVFEATEKFQPRESAPPIVWSRAAWSGQQRYPMGWGGDPQSDWEGLAASIRGGLSWGMSGNPYHSSDVGGFYGAEPSAELYVRWMQASVFSTHIRVHGVGEREPWAFGAEAEAIARKWLAFRYRLLPYLMQCIREATRTGMPVMRAMPLAFPRNALVARFETQFLCGDALLVAPIVAEGGEVEIAFPPGGWYDLNSRHRFAGRQVVRYRAPLDQFPVFGREGHALPLGRAVQHTGEIDRERPLEMLWVFGPPTVHLTGYEQVAIELSESANAVVRADRDVSVHVFGDQTVAVEDR